MILSTFLCLGASFVQAAPTASLPGFSIHERRSFYPHDLYRVSKVDDQSIIPLRIALRQANLEHGYNYLLDISHPSSPQYGQHWTVEQVDAAFAPSITSIDAVQEWLLSEGISETSIRKGWLTADVAASTAERLFNTEYYEYEDAEGDIRIGCEVYHLPHSITEHIDYIRPGVVLSPPVRKVKTRRGISEEKALSTLTEIYASEVRNLTAGYLDYLASQTDKSALLAQAATLFNGTETCGSFITPACLRALYGIPEESKTDSINTLGLFESEYQTYDQVDLEDFFDAFLPNASGAKPEAVSINNAPVTGSPAKAGGEILLDLTIAYSLIYPQEVKLYQTLGSQNIDKKYYSDYRGYEAFFDAVDGSYCDPAYGDSGADCGTAELTRVTSFSYGIPEILLPERLSKRMCNDSGDYGVASHPKVNTTGCIDPNFPTQGRNQANGWQNGTVFNPQWPDSCPYVLSVGATQLDPNETVYGAESVAVYASADMPGLAYGGGGAGFSNYYQQPSYQQKAVETYLSTHNPGYPTYTYHGINSTGANGGKYNRAGRGFPDVSANGNYFLLFNDNEVAFTGGTSMSTPVIASILTLIHQERTAAGKGPVGFVQPVLYEHPEIFNDITRGSNPGCGTAGFSAVKGWDPVTGLGTPKFPDMLQVFLELP